MSSYRIGYFHQGNQEPNNNNANQRNNVQPANEQNNENNAVQPDAAANGVAGEDVDPVPTNDEAAQEQNNRTPIIVLLRTFVLSFFASLIPETPAL